VIFSIQLQQLPERLVDGLASRNRASTTPFQSRMPCSWQN
jgi:hypothetical protein